jgi:hypothetical protein
MPEAKRLREKFSQVSTLAEVKMISDENIFNEESSNAGKIQNQIPVFLSS